MQIQMHSPTWTGAILQEAAPQGAIPHESHRSESALLAVGAILVRGLMRGTTPYQMPSCLALIYTHAEPGAALQPY